MARITPITCPNCSANIKPDKDKIFYCPYCGSALEYDDGSTDININYNHRINKTINKNIRITKTKRTEQVDYAKIAEAESEKRLYKALIIAMILFAGLMAAIYVPFFVSNYMHEKAAPALEAQGLVAPGKANDSFRGENYKVVMQQLKDAGFTNIETIELGVGIDKWNKEKVDSVSINGKTDYHKLDYFDPDTPVLISYK